MGVGREQSESIRGVAQTSAAPESIESAGRDRVLITRRNFLKHSSLTLASLAVSNPKSEASDAATLDPGSLKPFVDPLPIPTVAQPAGVAPESRGFEAERSRLRYGDTRNASESAPRSSSDAHVDNRWELSWSDH